MQRVRVIRVDAFVQRVVLIGVVVEVYAFGATSDYLLIRVDCLEKLEERRIVFY